MLTGSLPDRPDLIRGTQETFVSRFSAPHKMAGIVEPRPKRGTKRVVSEVK
jgi:hypothetical protein